MVKRPEKGNPPEKYAPLSQVNSTGQAKVIGDSILKKERNREFELSRSDRFRYRTRYFTDSGAIGSKEFVSKTYMQEALLAHRIRAVEAGAEEGA